MLLTRRPRTMRTFPGCWVLPGGAVDPVSEKASVFPVDPLMPLQYWNTGCLPLKCSGNPGVNGVPYRGVHGKRSGQGEATHVAALRELMEEAGLEPSERSASVPCD